ncbi:hypothetical protein DICVIV_10002 [Dictyocaulus viviparus]|uniref:Uncharacterized protein n=1 Tax=Dictyocaulus viviparus TaxID=29172 RepID=A0A0D8XJG7_DICVI|nr:hypothetical protein DICVIV_10002 [Dictyocaulus viviparus]
MNNNLRKELPDWVQFIRSALTWVLLRPSSDWKRDERLAPYDGRGAITNKYKKNVYEMSVVYKAIGKTLTVQYFPMLMNSLICHWMDFYVLFTGNRIYL